LNPESLGGARLRVSKRTKRENHRGAYERKLPEMIWSDVAFYGDNAGEKGKWAKNEYLPTTRDQITSGRRKKTEG